MAREYKDSGIEWIGQIPKEWEVGQVKQCFARKNEKAQLENPIVLSLAR
jgi:type I restriction enzyme S subunit